MNTAVQWVGQSDPSNFVPDPARGERQREWISGARLVGDRRSCSESGQSRFIGELTVSAA